MIPNIIFIAFLITGFLNLYSGGLYQKLANRGIAVKGGRPSFKKIKIAETNSTTEADRKLVKKCLKIYKTYVVLFYISVVAAILMVANGAIKKQTADSDSIQIINRQVKSE